MTEQAAGFWKVRHAVIGLAVVGTLAFLVIRGCSGDVGDATHNATSEPEIPQQGVYVQVPAAQLPRYPEVPQGYPQAGYGQQPAYGYAQQQAPATQQQPVYGYSTQPPVSQPQYPASDPGNPWATPAPGYQPQQPARWGQPQPAPVQQWGQPQQPVYTQLPSSQYRPLETEEKDRQPAQAAVIAPPVLAWSGNPYDRRGGSSFGNSNAANVWSGGYAGYGYNPGYSGAPYGAGPWSGGYMAGWPAGPGYPGYGWPGRW